MNAYGNDLQKFSEQQMTSWAIGIFGLKGLTVEWDSGAKVWDVECRSGWKTCRTPQELARLAKDVQRGNA